MHGATLLDASDQVLRPCILWNDTRSHAEAAEARRRSALPQDHRQHRLSRLHRAEARLGQEQRAGCLRQGAKVLLPKDYLRLWLTGEHMSEMSDSAGTSWLDVAKRRWSPELLAATDLTEGQMPALVEGTDPAGGLARRTRFEMGPEIRHPGRRRGRRQCGVGLRHGHGEARPRLRFARHVGRAVRRQRLVSAQSRKRGAHVLPCPAGHLASDGRHPVGDGFAQLALRDIRQKRRRPDRRTRR